ncbi:hypothetical protein BDB00DRAFT_499456 [Zychaea mexicana]|uniref:uncharacterized protein n=1 Tax=Zychaea mexicana TaxID=64656 RepID=UPI0022FEC124|nr:uncharacterized protein BDB00DRAFT_499456 [Zychaea mexicana]KAI9498119.1 hypothetical protein BDB00DRAFT_499456 [Zychaea mexicana]
MADNSSPIIRAIDRHCRSIGVCHCDWRLSIQDCEEGYVMWYINIVNIAISAITAVIGIVLLINRIFFKGHTIWNGGTGTRGWLRPKPVDSMIIFFIMFNSLRLLSSVIIITDALPGNWIARSYLFEIPWDFGLGGITLYLIGIAQTISQSHSVSSWLPSPLVVDIFGSTALFLPFVCSVAVAVTAGALAESDLPTAEIFVRLTYIAWFLWTGIIGCSVFYAGVRLVRILRSYHKKARYGPKYTAVKSGIYRIQMMVASFVVCLWGFATFLLLYSILRDQIMTNTAANIFLSIPWHFLGGITTLVVQISVMVSPKSKSNPALKSKSSSGETNNATSETGVSTAPDQENVGGSTIGAVTTMFQDDNEAILNAIKASDSKHKQQSSPYELSWANKKFSTHFFINKVPIRRASDASSQLELTSYDDR